MAHLSQEELNHKLAEALMKIQSGKRYTHYKDPEHEYEVIGLGFLEATDDVAVIYQAAYGSNHTFIRPVEDFLATVVVDGIPTLRFTEVS